MFDTIRRSIELTKASLAVLRADKELLLFPFRAETMSSAFRSKSGGASGFGQPR